MTSRKKLYIKTFGCQMNVYDSERIAQLLCTREYYLVDDPEQADLIFLNTCSIREKPEEKVYSALGRYRKLKMARPGLMIGVGGCVAQQEGERLLQRVPQVDFVLGTKEIGKIHELVEEREKMGKRGVALSLNGRMDPYKSLPLYPPAGKVKAFVSVMQGCDNFCSFCVVPYVRGREISRSSEEILKEIRLLSQQGIKEVTLIGQNVNSYGKNIKGEKDFRGLLDAVQEVAGIERIRFITSHPKDLSPSLIEAFGQLAKLCEHIHLPLQSGSDPILKKMNRGYSRLEYLEKIAALRQTCPGISITTDIIVGFPGETERDFQATLETIEEVQFDDLFSFQYSDRSQTRAASFSDKIPEEVSRRRLADVQERQKNISTAKNKAWEGKDDEVLVEGWDKTSGKETMGRSRSNRVVIFPGGNFPPGSLVRVRIQRALAHCLRGETRILNVGE